MASEMEKTVELEDAIRFNDLLSTGTSFKINHEIMAETIDDDIFDDGGSDGEENLSDDDADSKISPWKKGFDELKMLMVQLPNEYGRIYKRIVIDGNGDVIGQSNSRIKWTFSMFFENEDQAFDSQPKETTIEKREMLIGLQLALESMRKKEEAQFIIDYKLMFGEMGCPPRVKPKADILLVARIISFDETGDENACDDVPEEDRRKFHILKDKIIEMHKKALDHFKNHRYRYAIKVNQSVIRTLEMCQVANECEQKEQQRILNDIYCHQSDCYVKVQEWKKVCLMVNELRRRTNINRNVKILLNEGIALSYIDDEFQRSIALLRRAQNIEPHNEEVNSTLNDILAREEKYKKERKIMWQKALDLKSRVESQSQ